MSRHLEGLNEAQYRAVTYRGGPLLVLAGAGSGKTRVITRRVASLALDDGVPVEQILAVTFTNKAAGEMRRRVQSDTGTYSRWISTFHSACVRILRSWGAAIGIDPGFSIYDTDDSKKLIRRAIEEAQIDEATFQPSSVLTAIRKAKTEARTAAAVTEDAVSYYEEGVAAAYRAYERLLREVNALDFDDLLMQTVQLLQSEEGVRLHLQAQFPHVLVDEFQDTNAVQYQLLRHLVSPARQVCVTGDPDQSIYSWRGADIGNILGFAEDYPGTEIVRLEDNYRSSRTILTAADAVIAHNENRLDKTMRTDNDEGAPIELLPASDDREEARLIVRTIEHLIEAEGRSHGDFAVFFRTNAQSRPFEEAFATARLPHVIIGAFPFYERAEVKVLLSYLRFLINGRDALAFERAITNPRRKVGKKALTEIRALAASRHGGDLRQALFDPELPGRLKGASKGGAEAFRSLIEQLEYLPDFPTRPLMQLILEETGYLQLLQDAGETERCQHVGELLSAMVNYDSREIEGSLGHFLEGTALASELDRLPDSEDDDASKVALMTVHAAKGLEFPVVFVCGLEDGLFPLEHPLGDRDDPEEERRLFYVALTRAEERLFLTCASRRRRFGTQEYRARSRFLWEIPSEALAHSVAAEPDVEEGWPGPRRGQRNQRQAWPAEDSWGIEDDEGERVLDAETPVDHGAGSAGDGYHVEYEPEFQPAQPRSSAKRSRPRPPRPTTAFGLGFASATTQEPDGAGATDDDDTLEPAELLVGDLVEHPRFGQGKILELRQGMSPKVLVSFHTMGERLLDLRYGGLRRAGPFLILAHNLPAID